MPKRFVALRVLEGDEDFYRHLKDKRIIQKVKEECKEHPETAQDIAITKYGTASFITEKVTRIIPLEKEKTLERIDHILLNKITGPVITGLIILSIFGTLLYLGNIIQGLLTDLTQSFLSSLSLMENSIITAVLINGVTGLAIGVSIALPYVFLFYFCNIPLVNSINICVNGVVEIVIIDEIVIRFSNKVNSMSIVYQPVTCNGIL